MAAKKTPLRMCTGCGEMKPKKELLRIVRSKEGEVSVDPTGKKAGRGAYICPDAACFAKMRKSRRLERAFGAKIDDDIYDELEAALRA